MELQHLNLKVYCQEPCPIENTQAVIPVFHRWIQERVLGEELLIDVADYSHVPGGPGVLLIGHEAFYSLELGPEKRLGLLYNRRTQMHGTAQEKLVELLSALVRAAQLLEKESFLGAGKLRFDYKELKILCNDRCLSPNEKASFSQDLQDAFHRALASLSETFPDTIPAKMKLSYLQQDPRARFTMEAKA